MLCVHIRSIDEKWPTVITFNWYNTINGKLLLFEIDRKVITVHEIPRQIDLFTVSFVPLAFLVLP